MPKFDLEKSLKEIIKEVIKMQSIALAIMSNAKNAGNFELVESYRENAMANIENFQNFLYSHNIGEGNSASYKLVILWEELFDF